MMMIKVVVFMAADYYYGAAPSITIRPKRRSPLKLGTESHRVESEYAAVVPGVNLSSGGPVASTMRALEALRVGGRVHADPMQSQ